MPSITAFGVEATAHPTSTEWQQQQHGPQHIQQTYKRFKQKSLITERPTAKTLPKRKMTLQK
jgi:hypothetical protein